MGMELPPELGWLQWVVGSDWPEGDEDALWRLKDAWTAAASDINSMIGDGNSAYYSVLAGIDGLVAENFTAFWEKFSDGDQAYLTQLSTLCAALAQHCDQTALQIEYAKYQFIIALIVLAIQITYLLAMAAPSFGASTAAIPVAEVATQSFIRMVAQNIIRTMIFMVVQNVLSDTVIQAVQIGEGHRASFDASKTVQAAIDGAVDGAIFGAAGGAVHIGGSKIAPDFAKSFLGRITEGAAVNTLGSLGIAAATGEPLTFDNLAKTATAGVAASLGPHSSTGHGDETEAFHSEAGGGETPRIEPVDLTADTGRSTGVASAGAEPVSFASGGGDRAGTSATVDRPAVPSSDHIFNVLSGDPEPVTAHTTSAAAAHPIEVVPERSEPATISTTHQVDHVTDHGDTGTSHAAEQPVTTTSEHPTTTTSEHSGTAASGHQADYVADRGDTTATSATTGHSAEPATADRPAATSLAGADTVTRPVTGAEPVARPEPIDTTRQSSAPAQSSGYPPYVESGVPGRETAPATDGARTDSTRPDGSTRPESARTGNARPDSTRPDSARPDGARPDSTRPDSTRPDSARPDSTRASTPPAGSGAEHFAGQQHRPAVEATPVVAVEHPVAEHRPDNDFASRSPEGQGWSGEGKTLDPAENAIADRFLAHAAESERSITPQLESVAERAGGRLEGLDHVLKDPESFKRKLSDQLADDRLDTAEPVPVEYSLSEMKDAVRYTVEFTPEKYTSGAREVVDHLASAVDEHGDPRFEQVKFKNFWGTEKGYVGINSFWLDRATGQTFEVQIHTPDSFEAKTVTHHDLEIERTTTDPQIEADARNRADEVFATVDRPEGAAAIGLPEGTTKLSEAERADRMTPFTREGDQPTSGTPPGETADHQRSRSEEPPGVSHETMPDRPADSAHEGQPDASAETSHDAPADAPEAPDRSRFVSDDEAVRLVRENARPTPSGYAFYPEGDHLNAYAEAVHPVEGVVNLDLHGSPAGFHIDGRILTGEQFAHAVDSLRAEGRLTLGENQPIRLAACDVARGPDSPAARFARESGHPVTAPTERMWSDRHGNEHVASAVLKDGRWVPKDPPDGQWHTFEPTDSGRPAEAPARPSEEPRSPSIEDPAARSENQPGHGDELGHGDQLGHGDESGPAGPVTEPVSWGIPEFPRSLPDGHPLLTPTDTINTPEREAFRQSVIDDVLGNASAPESGKPVVYLMGGGGASGKGYVLSLLHQEGTVPTENVVHLDPDGIKSERIPEYQQIVAAGDSRAAAVVHEESSTLAKRILAGAIERQANIVYDVTLGDPRKAIDTLQRLRSQGYEIQLFGVSADADVAVLRNSSRAAETGRYVPIDMQLTAHRGFSRGFEAYADLADSVRLYDTNGRQPVLVAAKIAGDELVVVDPDRYDSFQQKGELDPHAAGPVALFPEPREITPPEHPYTSEQYVDKAMDNLSRTSRTAAGTVDTSASVEKAGQMAADLSGDRAAAMAQGNYRSVLTELYTERDREIGSPAELREMVEGKVREVNSGILKEGVLYREHDSTKYPSYTAAAELPAAADQFFTEFHERLSDPRADPVETAAWVEYRMDMTDHLWADGCGKSAKAIAAWVLMRHGYDLPSYPSERSAQFADAPRLPRAAGPGIDGLQYSQWVSYYRGLFGGSDG